MGKFIFGLIIPIIILIIIFIISTKKKPPVVNQQQGNTPAPVGNVTTPPSTQTVTPKTKASKTSSGAGSTILEIIGTILLWTAIVVFIILGIRYLQNGDLFKKKVQKSEIVREKNIKTLPDSYVEYHHLKKGEVIRVYKPDGYTCNYYGGGKKYYCQPQNHEKIILGGGDCSNIKMFNSKYVDLSYYNEEITVMCEFTKIN